MPCHISLLNNHMDLVINPSTRVNRLSTHLGILPNLACRIYDPRKTIKLQEISQLVK